MKRRRKAPRAAPGHCSFKRFSSKTEDGEQCCAQITRSERSAGSGTVSSFSEPEERRRGNQRAPRRAEGGPRVKDRDTGGDKAPHPQEALDFTAPLAPRRRCDAKKKQKKNNMHRHGPSLRELFGNSAAFQVLPPPSPHHPLCAPLRTLLYFRGARREKK